MMTQSLSIKNHTQVGKVDALQYANYPSTTLMNWFLIK